MSIKKKEVDYAEPPIVEVVLGIAFEEISEFEAPHFGILASVVGSDFPHVKQVPPRLVGLANANLGEFPIRCWYTSPQERRVLQVQKDSFYFNWRRMREDAAGDYPEFSKIYPQFKLHLETLRDFLRKQFGRELQVIELELTYLNVIQSEPMKSYLEVESDVLVDHQRAVGERFLPKPSDFNWTTNYQLPDQSGQLKVAAASVRVKDTEEPVIRVELSARGAPPGGASLERIDDWFDLAHDYIVKGFSDITNKEIQEKVWRKR